MYAELLGKDRARLTILVALDELRSLRIVQSDLFPVDRWDGSMGRSFTALTTADLPKTRQDVGVGITAQQVHPRCRFDNV